MSPFDVISPAVRDRVVRAPSALMPRGGRSQAPRAPRSRPHPATATESLCRALYPGRLLACTRPAGHEHFHEARGAGFRLLGTWAAEEGSA